jgi:hypothetical protein
MPSLEVVGPGDGLSTVPSATPFGKTAGGSSNGGTQLRRLLFGWGTAGGGDSGVVPASGGDGLEICVFVFIRSSRSVIRPFSIMFY